MEEETTSRHNQEANSRVESRPDTKFKKGHKTNLGRHFIRKGVPLSEETKIKIGLANKGRKPSPLTLQKSLAARTGKSLTAEHRKKISEGNKGRAGFWKGKKMSDEHKSKIQNALKGRMPKFVPCIKGERSNFWRGGVYKSPYSADWTKTLKRSIRERDNYICQMCSQYGNNIHHIDKNKQNCDPLNLITLCNRCHGKQHNKK